MRSILVIGAGRFGVRLTGRLAAMGAEVMIMDKDENRLKAAEPYATRILVGDAANGTLMGSIGVPDFDDCIVAIGDDFLASLEVTSLLKELGAQHVISRAARDTQEKFLLRNGADEVIYPEKQMANWVAMRVGAENVFDYLELEEGYGIYEILVPEPWIGHTIGELNIRNKYRLNILAVKDGRSMNIAVGIEYCFMKGQTILVLGNQEDIRSCMEKLSGKKR